MAHVADFGGEGRIGGGPAVEESGFFGEHEAGEDFGLVFFQAAGGVMIDEAGTGMVEIGRVGVAVLIEFAAFAVFGVAGIECGPFGVFEVKVAGDVGFDKVPVFVVNGMAEISAVVGGVGIDDEGGAIIKDHGGAGLRFDGEVASDADVAQAGGGDEGLGITGKFRQDDGDDVLAMCGVSGGGKRVARIGIARSFIGDGDVDGIGEAKGIDPGGEIRCKAYLGHCAGREAEKEENSATA